MKRIAVIGSRGFSNYEYFTEKLEYLIQNIPEFGFVSGGDFLIKKYCKEKGYNLIEYFPEYDKYHGKVAPIKRNDIIVENSDMLIAFWDGKSKGTLYTINKAKDKQIPIRIINI